MSPRRCVPGATRYLPGGVDGNLKICSRLLIAGLDDIKFSGELHWYTPARTYPSDSEARPVGMSKTGCYRKFWSQSTAMIDYEFGSPFIASLLGESANWPAAARAFGEQRGCVPGPPLRNIWSRRTTMMNSLVGSSFNSRHRGVSSKNQRRGARAFLGLLGAAAPSGQVAELVLERFWRVGLVCSSPSGLCCAFGGDRPRSFCAL